MEKLNTQVIIECLEKNLQEIQGVYLFGSFGTDSAHSKSDVDIAVLCPSKLSFEIKEKITTALAIALRREVDLVELRYVDTFFQEEIIKTGKCIAVYDRMLLERYKDYIYCSAMEFREFRRPHVEEILARGSLYG
jgi:predicted nucleotidyltransferase